MTQAVFEDWTGSAVESGKPNLPMYVTILNGIQEQIRFADLKAGFITTLNALLFSFLATQSDSIWAGHASRSTWGAAFWCATALQVLYLSATGLAVGVVILSVVPRFGTLVPENKVFFGHIIKHYGKDSARYVQETCRLTDEEWAEQIGTQIVDVAHIALTKHLLVRRATWFTLLAFALWRASLFAMAFLPAR